MLSKQSLLRETKIVGNFQSLGRVGGGKDLWGIFNLTQNVFKTSSLTTAFMWEQNLQGQFLL